MMVRTMDPQKKPTPAKTPKILNLYNKGSGGAATNNKKNAVVLTTSLHHNNNSSPTNNSHSAVILSGTGGPVGGGPNGGAVTGSHELLDFDSSEITVIFEDEIETLYVGPVAISEEEQQKKRLLEEAKAANTRSSGKRQKISGAGAGGQASSSHSVLSNNKQLSPADSSLSNGSDSGIDTVATYPSSNTNNHLHNNNKNIIINNNNTNSTAATTTTKATGSNSTIKKKRGRPSAAAAREAGDSAQLKLPQMMVQRTPKERVPSPKPSYECDLCNEIFMREDTIIDHYQSYHRVDPKKRSINPRLSIPTSTKDTDKAEEAGQGDAVPIKSPSRGIKNPAVSDDDEDDEQDLHSPKRGPKAGAASTKKEPELRCDECGLTFKNKIWQSRHMNKMHPEPSPTQTKKSESVTRKAQTSAVEIKREMSSPRTKSPQDQKKRSPMPRPSSTSASQNTNTALTAPPVALKSPTSSTRGRKRKAEIVPKVDVEAEVGVKAERVNTADLTKDAFVEKTIYVKVIEQSEHPEEGEEILYEIRERTPTSEEEDEDDDEDDDDEEGDVEEGDEEGCDPMAEKKYRCRKCGARFTKKCSLRPHIMRVHKKRKDKECTFCGRMFTMTGDLTRHIRIHTGEKPFKCDYPDCSFRFITKSDLNKHSRRHWKDIRPMLKAHRCDICGTAFERSYDLRRHKVTHKLSTPDEAFQAIQCELCEKTFTRKDEYKAHSLRHLGLKSFKCHVCGKPFADMSNCAKHVKLHGVLTHNGHSDPLCCEYCDTHCPNNTAISRHLIRCGKRFDGMVAAMVPSYDYFEDWK